MDCGGLNLFAGGQFFDMRKFILLCGGVVAGLLPGAGFAITNVYFNPAQVATVVTTNMTATTIRSEGYRFTYTVDGYWSAEPGGTPT